MGSAGLSETAADGAGGSALGKRGSVASGAGRQPNRRSFPDHFLVETDPSSDPAIAEALGFEAQNDSVARGDVGYRILCGSPLRPDQGMQSSPVQALLKTGSSTRGVH